MALVFRRIDTVFGELLVAVSAAGVCRISFPHEVSGRWLPWFDRYFDMTPRDENHPWLKRVEMQIQEYFAGERREFRIPLDLRGPEFHLMVWERLLKIPFGETSTYGELAREFGLRGGARAVGAAAAANPVPILVPCHRLVGNRGRLVGFIGGLQFKERLLELEGARIPFGQPASA